GSELQGRDGAQEEGHLGKDREKELGAWICGGGSMSVEQRDNGGVEEEPVSPLTRLFHQPCLDCYIVGIMGFGKPLDVDVVKSGLEATLVRHPPFSSMPSTPQVIEEAGGKKAKWVRTEVVVNHIPPSLATPWTTPAPSGTSTSSTSPPSTPLPSQCSASTTPSATAPPSCLRPRLPSHNPQPLPPASARLREAPCGCFYAPLVAVDLCDACDVKNAMHCSVNDVLVGVTSAGLSRYLSRRYGHTDNDDSEKNQLPSNIRLRSTLIVNIRPIPGIHALAELMEGRDDETKWGNFIGYIILPFSIMRRKNPLDYIRRAKATADRRKNSLEAIFTYKGAGLIIKCFCIRAAAALCYRVLLNKTLSMSNMIGPVQEIMLYVIE
ncbi:unnamed protein product, partial [Musa textilis]